MSGGAIEPGGLLAREVGEDELAGALDVWERDGIACLPGVAADTTLEALRERAGALVRGTVVVDGLFFQPDSPTGSYADLEFGSGYAGPDRDYRKIEKLERDTVFRAWMENALFARVARRVLGPRVTLYRATLFWKAALRGSDLPHHQDGGRFWGLDRDPRLQIWTALDDATPESGCLTVVPGTHRLGLATPLGGIVPRAVLEAAAIEGRERSVPARAGDVLLVHNALWHRSGPNRTPASRRALSLSLLDADTRCTRKKRAPRVFPVLFEA